MNQMMAYSFAPRRRRCHHGLPTTEWFQLSTGSPCRRRWSGAPRPRGDGWSASWWPALGLDRDSR